MYEPLSMVSVGDWMETSSGTSGSTIVANAPPLSPGVDSVARPFPLEVRPDLGTFPPLRSVSVSEPDDDGCIDWDI